MNAQYSLLFVVELANYLLAQYGCCGKREKAESPSGLESGASTLIGRMALPRVKWARAPSNPEVPHASPY